MWATLTRCTAAGLDRRSGPPGLRLTLRVVDGAALVESAQVALAEGDVVGAVARLREAVAVRPNPSAREQLAGLLFFEDDLVSARQELELAFREWRTQGEARAAALVAASLADLHSSGFGNRVVGQGWISRARRLLESEGRCVEQGYVELAVIACETHDVERLEQATRFALELAGEFGDSELEVRALADSGYALVVQGRVAEGFAQLDEAMAALSAGEVRNPATAGKSYCALMSACERTGDLARAEEWTRVINETLSQSAVGKSRIMYAHCRHGVRVGAVHGGSVADGFVLVRRRREGGRESPGALPRWEVLPTPTIERGLSA